MTDPADYGHLFRTAYTVLHGGHTDEPTADSSRHSDEPLEEFLARVRSDALDKLRGRMEGAEPPEALRDAHDLLVRLLASATEADTALAAQVEAYRCGNFPGSISHSDRLHALITESARLDRDLIAALRQADSAAPGTLSALGIDDLPAPP
ncbi:MAG: hypothetical protein V3S20_07800 [Dehalococcoidia bacterium]